MAKYISVYPPAHNDTYVKATTKDSVSFWQYFATDPAKSLIGSPASNAWVSTAVTTNQRFHIDLGVPRVVRRIYFENNHTSGTPIYDAKNFTFQGSNAATAFAELTYAVNTDWTNLTTVPTILAQHSAFDASDPQYVTVNNTTAYRYYAIKFADTYDAGYMGIRRIELQILSYRSQIISF